MKEELKKIPGVDKLLLDHEIIKLKEKYGVELVTFAIRQILPKIRDKILKGKKVDKINDIILQVKDLIYLIAGSSLKPVINATGIILHTNLGRAPLGRMILNEIEPVITGYSNLEFNLKNGTRGQRNAHISELIKFITKAEDAVVVNNNAAAVMLCLKTFAENNEVIISRGELIEIGGSFRIPEIMKASGAKMVEVGTTNRTRLSDYEEAITKNTKIIFKAHKSNYQISGFTEEVGLEKLSKLARKHNLLFIYDIGSGLLRRPEKLPLEREPDVLSSIKSGADIVMFSGDKLLGGPQAGIIVGRKELIRKIAKAPLMRTLRVGKFTISALSTVISYYLKEEKLLNNLPMFMLLNRNKNELEKLAEKLLQEFKKNNIKAEIVDSFAQVGGGTLPDLKIDSYAVKLINSNKDEKFAEKLFKKLLQLEQPVLGILREGNLLFDVHSIFEEDIQIIYEAVDMILSKERKGE